jgi:hypothetical protein
MTILEATAQFTRWLQHLRERLQKKFKQMASNIRSAEQEYIKTTTNKKNKKRIKSKNETPARKEENEKSKNKQSRESDKIKNSGWSFDRTALQEKILRTQKEQLKTSINKTIEHSNLTKNEKDLIWPFARTALQEKIAKYQTERNKPTNTAWLFARAALQEKSKQKHTHQLLNASLEKAADKSNLTKREKDLVWPFAKTALQEKIAKYEAEQNTAKVLNMEKQEEKLTKDNPVIRNENSKLNEIKPKETVWSFAPTALQEKTKKRGPTKKNQHKQKDVEREM